MICNCKDAEVQLKRFADWKCWLDLTKEDLLSQCRDNMSNIYYQSVEVELAVWHWKSNFNFHIHYKKTTIS